MYIHTVITAWYVTHNRILNLSQIVSFLNEDYEEFALTRYSEKIKIQMTDGRITKEK
jgi:hypothetical protein